MEILSITDVPFTAFILQLLFLILYSIVNLRRWEFKKGNKKTRFQPRKKEKNTFSTKKNDQEKKKEKKGNGQEKEEERKQAFDQGSKIQEKTIPIKKKKEGIRI